MINIFGPIKSRRFGLSLGIDLSPQKKECNFDCLYCELIGSKPIEKMEPKEFDSELFRAQLKEHLKKLESQNIIPDVLTITANGEPTLYPHLSEVIKVVNELKGNSKSLILSNGSTIYKKEIQEALLDLDIVKLSLDCVSLKCFKKLDRFHKSVEIEKIIDGMVEFRSKYSGMLVLETLFVEGINDNESEIELLKEAVSRIKPDRYDLSTIDRPPAYNVKGVKNEWLDRLKDKMGGINLFIAKSSNA